jgi:hypothetical protein
MFVRLFVGSVLWFAASWGATAIYSGSSVTFYAWLVGEGAASVGLGWLVGNWWALLGPALAGAVLSIGVIEYSPGDSEVIPLVWLFGVAPVAACIYAGIRIRSGQESSQASP